MNVVDKHAPARRLMHTATPVRRAERIANLNESSVGYHPAVIRLYYCHTARRHYGTIDPMACAALLVPAFRFRSILARSPSTTDNFCIDLQLFRRQQACSALVCSSYIFGETHTSLRNTILRTYQQDRDPLGDATGAAHVRLVSLRKI